MTRRLSPHTLPPTSTPFTLPILVPAPHSGLLASSLASKDLILQFIRQPIMCRCRGGLFMHISLSTTADVEFSNAFAAQGRFGDDVDVVGVLGRGFEAGGADVGGAAAAGGVGSVALVAYNAFTDDVAVGVGGVVSGDVCGASTSMRNERFVSHIVVEMRSFRTR